METQSCIFCLRVETTEIWKQVSDEFPFLPVKLSEKCSSSIWSRRLANISPRNGRLQPLPAGGQLKAQVSSPWILSGWPTQVQVLPPGHTDPEGQGMASWRQAGRVAQPQPQVHTGITWAALKIIAVWAPHLGLLIKLVWFVMQPGLKGF